MLFRVLSSLKKLTIQKNITKLHQHQENMFSGMKAKNRWKTEIINYAEAGVLNQNQDFIQTTADDPYLRFVQ